jgi:hypothetical protein
MSATELWGILISVVDPYFLFIKTLDPYPDPDSLEMLDPDQGPDQYPDPHSMNPDPQH